MLCSCRFLPILLTANSCSHHHFEKHLERKLPFDTSSNHQSPQSLWHRQMELLQKICMEDFTKRRPQLGPNFLGCNQLPWCNLEIVRRRQCCKAAWIQVLSAPATRPAAKLVGFGRKRYACLFPSCFFFMFLSHVLCKCAFSFLFCPKFSHCNRCGS